MYGVDKTLVYDRKTYSQPLGWEFFRDYSRPTVEEEIKTNFNYHGSPADFYRKFLFIGGRFYSYFRAVIYKRKHYLIRKSEIEYEELIFNEEQLRTFGEKYCEDGFFNNSRQRTLYRANFDLLSRLLISVPSKVKQLANKEPLFTINHADLLKSKTPTGYEVTYNPCLRQLGVHTFFPAYKVHQDISMWLASHKESPAIPHIDDLTMSQAKGFDKYSFRKDPK